MELFRFGDFTLASGRRSRYKLECTAISADEWHTLARLALSVIPHFGTVIGVPKGGLLWAEVFKHYSDPNSHATLFVDDVWTTGGSMNVCVATNSWTQWHGVILFARGPLPYNVTALFTAHPGLE